MRSRITVSLFAAALLAGCSQEDKPAPAAPELPIRYATINLADVSTAEAMTRICEAEEKAGRDHLAALESFQGEPTLEGYYRSFDSLTTSLISMGQVGGNMGRLDVNADVRQAGEACDQLITRVQTDISLSRPVYDALSRIDLGGADAISRRSIEKMLLDYRLAGVDKDEATREKIRALKDRILTIGQEFDRNMREDVRYLEIDSAEDLAGLPADYISAHPPGDDGKIRISTQYPDYFPFMEYADRDDLRKQMRLIDGQRGYPANEEVLRKLIEARYELARLIGFDNFAELATADKMIGSPERAREFINELKDLSGETQDREYDLLLARLQQDNPDAKTLEAWQDSYIKSKVSREQFGVDSKVVREYFRYNIVKSGIFAMVEDLFGVRFEPWDTYTWQEDVEAWEMYDDDRLIGRFYLDMHPRDGKYQHAAAFLFNVGIDGVQEQVNALICNFPRGDEPMQFTQVETFLHEFGHLIHAMYSGHQPWGNLFSSMVEWDFVEAPSQMLEEWLWDYDTLSAFARNAQGEVLPRELFDKMSAQRDFGIGLTTRGQLGLAMISLSTYDRPPAEVNFDQLWRDTFAEFSRFPDMEGRHAWASFSHLNNYSAYYYTYQWSLAIATDMFTRFEEAGLRNVEVARAYRDKVLAPGASRPAEDLVTDFLGRDISFEPYARKLQGAL
jgi:thimet oligopeptidase